MTLTDLQKAEEARKTVIANLFEEVNRQTATRDELKKKALQAAKATDMPTLSALTEEESLCDRRIATLRDAIEEASNERYFGDADCIDAANGESDKAIAELAKMSLEISKLKTRLALLLHDAAELTDKTNKARAFCLVYHSKYGIANADQVFATEGLKELPSIPNMTVLFPLVQEAYPGEADIIRNALLRF